MITSFRQPPLGGCVLKLKQLRLVDVPGEQPPLGGCVLKLKQLRLVDVPGEQPPLGGCVLKPSLLPSPNNSL